MELQDNFEALLREPAYGVPHEKKAAMYAKMLAACTRHHGRHCPPYGQYLRAIGCREGSLFYNSRDGFAPMRPMGEEDGHAPMRPMGEEDGHAPMRPMGEEDGLAPTRPVGEEDIPFLPVSAFKEMELRSVPRKDVCKVITSSGTTGQLPSRIVLDARTSAAQQKVLARIVTEDIGTQRLPCLILDTRSVLRDRRQFSARGAGILGFSMFATRTCYALDEKMELNLDEIRSFIEAQRQKALEKGQKPRFLLYGFTFMVWQYFVRALEEKGATLDLKGSVLIHGGGWKKLQAKAVSPEEFAARVRAATGIETVRSYYGMAEQTGCICMECACGHLHASVWSDILVRREEDYGLCGIGEPGILQVLTPIAMSYPGHSLLTEDRAVLLGEDDCPCGRKGKYFRVLGRLPRAEVRGCSDTFEDPEPVPPQAFPGRGTGESFFFPPGVRLLAGTEHPAEKALETFSPEAVSFLDAFSRALKRDSRLRGDPEVMALAFWCRRAHILSLRERHSPGLGRGRIFHLAPANVPMMFAYTWIIGLLAGNSGIVRISERTLAEPPVQAVLDVLGTLLSEPAHGAVREHAGFISYPHSDGVTEEILKNCDGRVLWGGDETIRRMRAIPMPAHAVELAFPDRVSIAVLCEDALAKMGEEELRRLVHRFYNDTYGMDQNGCSSPQTVVWMRGKDIGQAAAENGGPAAGSGIREKWWELLAEEAKAAYALDGFRAARKLEKAALAAMRPCMPEGCQLPDLLPDLPPDGGQAGETAKAAPPDGPKEQPHAEERGQRGPCSTGAAAPVRVDRIRRYGGNALYTLRLSRFPDDLAAYRGGFGLFFETEADSAAQLFGGFSARMQTVVCIGISPQALAEDAAAESAAGALRFVPAGQALQFDAVWDGTDLVAALSRRIYS